MVVVPLVEVYGDICGENILTHEVKYYEYVQ